ncbi:hypothetical protein TPHA_0E00970 [Tetrapisispora phaffii CBS 4417]|uniref:Uncharacterized protein n=1 Tax=Tetrapisispora phaffii (strain ATCC 24235 / CBS 4417 / NBRC 1672 / NRRL Y-8282 / UCD 70-5) TaxID=1071381 RepID=G8BTG3_TETPH|nr:hypothetical protein TPHA_0E00970 [Tetrapisispora phaffii CBS 4417]CCE63191.1 hypothetical protein TPHA_0E00970 [Tetrapisispora phaffii CBS 4417]
MNSEKQYQKLVSRHDELIKQDLTLRKEYTTLLRKCQSLFYYLNNDKLYNTRIIDKVNRSIGFTMPSSRYRKNRSQQKKTSDKLSKDENDENDSMAITKDEISSKVSELNPLEYLNAITNKGVVDRNKMITNKILKRKITDGSIKKLPDLKWYNDQLELVFEQLDDNTEEFELPEEIQNSYELYKTTPLLYNDIKDDIK